jgi:hypothetical protein
MKKRLAFSLVVVLFGTLIFSGCTSTSQAFESGQDTQLVIEAQEENTTNLPEESPVTATGTPVEVSISNESVSKVYAPLWSAGTLLSDEDKKGWGLITKVNSETSQYYFRNVIYPDEGEPYIIKDSTFEEMGTTFSAKGIDKKYINFEGKVVKIAIVSSTGSSVLGYLEYYDNKSMKHTVGE